MVARRNRQARIEDARTATTPWWDDPQGRDQWDYVYIAGTPLPCAGFPEAEPGRKIDTKSAPGSDGARYTDKGLEPATVKIGVKLWTEFHLEVWDEITGRLMARRRLGDRRPFNVQHPVLEQLGIREVILQKITTLKAGSEHGVKEASLTCLEYIQPSPRPVTRPQTMLGRTLSGIPDLVAVHEDDAWSVAGARALGRGGVALLNAAAADQNAALAARRTPPSRRTRVSDP